MKKTILITGHQRSGKTTKAKEIASQFQKEEVVFLSFHGKNTLDDKFLFSECKEKTKLIVFEELSDLAQVQLFFNMVSNPIVVNKRMKEPFSISPQFVLVCQSDIQQDQLVELGASFHRRFEVLNTNF
jgi:uridine kinase